MGRKSREKRERRQPPPWTPFAPATVEGQHQVRVADETFKLFVNSRYTVLVRRVPPTGGWPQILHLSIKRNDGEPVHDWRDLQRIKNEIVGHEHEGVELYPAESRLVDGANQYHLFVLTDPSIRFPFGYQERLVAEGNAGGAKQRPFNPDARPADVRVLAAEEIERAKASAFGLPPTGENV
jgi:hypothetical protein